MCGVGSKLVWDDESWKPFGIQSCRIFLKMPSKNVPQKMQLLSAIQKVFLLDVSIGVEMRLLEGPTNQNGLNLGIHMLVYVYKVHMCINMLGGRMRSWTNYFFCLKYVFIRKSKEKDVNVKSET